VETEEVGAERSGGAATARRWLRMIGMPRSGFINLAPTSVANKNRRAPGMSRLGLKYRFLTVLKAGCADPMRRLARLHSWLCRIGRSPRVGQVLQLIALLFSFPVFHVYYSLFKFTVAVNQRQMRQLPVHVGLISGRDNAQKLDDLFLNKRLVPDAEERLRDIQSHIQRVRDATDQGHIYH